MKVERAIKERRSVREFSSQKVSWEDLTDVLNSTIYAPMAGNVFSIRLVVVSDKEKKRDIAVHCLEQYFMQQAPYLIVVCSDLTQVKRLYGDFAEQFGTIQAGAAVQNMLLQATELELATCWIGSFDEEPIKSILNIPDNIHIEAIIAIGHPKRKVSMPKKVRLESVTFFEEYGLPGGWKEVHPEFWGVRESVLEK